MTKFDKLKERFPDLIPVQELRSSISIIELAIYYGYEFQLHKGKKRPVLEHSGYQDTLIIKNPQDASQQVYQRAGNFADSGTLIDFVRNRLPTVFSRFNNPNGHELRNITSVLYDYLRIDPTFASRNHWMTTKSAELSPKHSFIQEQFDIRPLEPNNYLITRQISPITLQRPEFIGKVVSQITYFNLQTGCTDDYTTVKKYPERRYRQFSNVAFPYYDGQSTNITGLELRNETVKLHAPGSDRYGSVFVSNAPAKSLNFYVMESAIDALSHRQLRSICGDGEFDSVYFSTGGQLTNKQVDTITRYISSFGKKPKWKINLAFDNDINGCRFDLQFIQQLVFIKLPMSPTISDVNWNRYLLAKSATYQSIQTALLNRIDTYNKKVQFQLAKLNQNLRSEEGLNNKQIIVRQFTSHIEVNIPQSCDALITFCQDLLELTGLARRTVILKANRKDFNEDLVYNIGQPENLNTTKG